MVLSCYIEAKMLTKVSACITLVLLGTTFLTETESVEVVGNTNIGANRKYPDTMARRFLMTPDTNISTWSWRQRVACLTMCVPGYETDTVACCITGDNKLCLSLPLGLLSNSIGSCSGWSDWGPWERCSVTCNTGIQKRHRNCTHPVPGMCGNFCVGDNADARLCTPGHCVVNGNWAGWALWSTCGVTCGTGTQTRTRTCTNPAPEYSGLNCIGDDQEHISCHRSPCPTHCVDKTPAATCHLASSIVCQDRTHAVNANCAHYCGFC